MRSVLYFIVVAVPPEVFFNFLTLLTSEGLAAKHPQREAAQLPRRRPSRSNTRELLSSLPAGARLQSHQTSSPFDPSSPGGAGFCIGSHQAFPFRFLLDPPRPLSRTRPRRSCRQIIPGLSMRIRASRLTGGGGRRLTVLRLAPILRVSFFGVAGLELSLLDAAELPRRGYFTYHLAAVSGAQ